MAAPAQDSRSELRCRPARPSATQVPCTACTAYLVDEHERLQASGRNGRRGQPISHLLHTQSIGAPPPPGQGGLFFVRSNAQSGHAQEASQQRSCSRDTTNTKRPFTTSHQEPATHIGHVVVSQVDYRGAHPAANAPLAARLRRRGVRAGRAPSEAGGPTCCCSACISQPHASASPSAPLRPCMACLLASFLLPKGSLAPQQAPPTRMACIARPTLGAACTRCRPWPAGGRVGAQAGPHVNMHA